MFVAGATGVIGRSLLPRLAEHGHRVTALVHESAPSPVPETADTLVRGNLLEPERLCGILEDAAPEVVIHVASGFREWDPAAGMRRTARLRQQGTSNLVAASLHAGARRIVAQSVAAYEPGGTGVADERTPLFTTAPGHWGEAVRAAERLEELLFDTSELETVVLRLGELYGAGTCYARHGRLYDRVKASELPLVGRGSGMTSFTHVEDVARAVLLASHEVEPAVYNIVDNEPAESAEWLPAYAGMIGAPEPVSLTPEQARRQLDWETVHRLAEQRGATNFRFREATGWRPRWPTWREGFAELFGLWPS
ncbi:NAD-dependent epimerase/dehydratase family protein [Actinopolyspora mortivallis]|uniref:NAD-dependent epimerase/dehydratase family protein n=1 Tax=Actinopolyspora mortivallis TaxID=33906 RepID=UPI001FDED1DC|nr:NAD(P)-dependent oxidoreductase [Actinopolyspora mortivallis]